MRNDLTWAVTRLSPTNLFTAEDLTREDEEKTNKQTIPDWSGYNSLVFPDTTRPTVIGYCPMIHESSTEFSTIKTVMKKAQNIALVLIRKTWLSPLIWRSTPKRKRSYGNIQTNFPTPFFD